MTVTRSVTQLRKDFGEILRLREQRKTVIVTRYGKPDIVIMDAASYEFVKVCAPQPSETRKSLTGGSERP